jgi:hypothetical protein
MIHLSVVWIEMRPWCLAPPEGLPHAQVGTSIIHRELKKVKFPEFFGAPRWRSHRGMVGEYGDVLFNLKLYL